MKLYLIQHGESLAEDVDPKRPLSGKGRADVESTAAFMARNGVRVDEIWHSVKLRAKQTAEIIAEALKVKKVIEKKGLAPNDPGDVVATEINASDNDIVIASHLPFLQKLSSLLLTGSESHQIIKFRQGGVVCLEKTDSVWSVVWMVGPGLNI
jgi:phosphohistidine phosphatase